MNILIPVIIVIVIVAPVTGILLIPMFEESDATANYFDARDCEIGTSTDEFGVTKCMTLAEKEYIDNLEPSESQKLSTIIENQETIIDLLEDIYDLDS